MLFSVKCCNTCQNGWFRINNSTGFINFPQSWASFIILQQTTGLVLASDLNFFVCITYSINFEIEFQYIFVSVACSLYLFPSLSLTRRLSPLPRVAQKKAFGLIDCSSFGNWFLCTFWRACIFYGFFSLSCMRKVADSWKMHWKRKKKLEFFTKKRQVLWIIRPESRMK